MGSLWGTISPRGRLNGSDVIGQWDILVNWETVSACSTPFPA